MKQDNRNSLIPIGKMATANKVTIATLRLYDQMGLLKPAFIDPDSGYRYYTIQQTSRLDFIRYMRELGLSLADIQSILEKEDVTLIEEKLIEKNNQIHQQLRELKAMHEAVDRTIQSIERYRKSPSSGMISLEFIDQRYILYAPCAVNFYETGIVAYEKIIHDLRTGLMEKGLPQILSYNLGTSILLSDFEAERFIPDQVFIFGDRHLQDYGDTIRVLDSGMYACIYLDSFDEEISAALKLKEYCRDQGYALTGDYICEELTEFNVFDMHRRNMFLRLQIPVKFQKNA